VYNVSNTRNMDCIKLVYKMFVEKPERKRPFHDLEADRILILTLWNPKCFCGYRWIKRCLIYLIHVILIALNWYTRCLWKNLYERDHFKTQKQTG